MLVIVELDTIFIENKLGFMKKKSNFYDLTPIFTINKMNSDDDTGAPSDYVRSVKCE